MVAAAFYLLWKIMPPYVQAYQFQEELQTIARNNEYSQASIEKIRDEVKRKIDDTGVPIAPESVIIYRTGNFDLVIGANYTVHVDALVHPFDMNFHPATKNGSKIDPIPNRTP